MTDTLPAVALLFDDRELGGHLRAALQERGARIVHEGGVSGFSRELLNRVGADVVVVNLEDNADDALDRLYEVIDGDQPRVVFNDADASRTLAGWDRARWARHLAVKVLAIGDLDPPRPEDALAVDEPFASQDVSILDEPVVVETQSPPATSTDLTATMDDSMASSDVTSTESVVSLVADFQPNPDVDADPVWASQLQPELLQQSEHEPELGPELGLQLQSALEPELESKSELKPEPDANLEPESLPGTEPEWLAAPVCGDEQENEVAADVATDDVADNLDHDSTEVIDSDSLAAELEALLASADILDGEDDISGPVLRYVRGKERPALHDGDFSTLLQAPDEAIISDNDQAPSSEPTAQSDIDPVSLAADSDPSLVGLSGTAVEPVATASSPVVQAPAGWALLDDDAAPLAQASTPAPSYDKGAAEFGIEKLSAVDFLAPDAEPSVDDFEPIMSLELVSIEEAIAPQAYVPAHEMVLDELGSALSRVVLLGSAVDGMNSVCAFLQALPANTPQAFLLTQHLGTQSAAAVVEQFSEYCSLPVRLANVGVRAKAGEVLLVPAGHQVRLRRDGSIELQAQATEGEEPSIDASLSMAAAAFGRDALAIIFAGRGNDAVAGAQAIHDRGGQVWVESSSGEHFADMVSGIFAERLVSFSGTPPELAAHLSEVFS